VKNSFECVTAESGAVHSGAIELTVSSMYTTTSEGQFTFQVVFRYPITVSVITIFSFLVSFNGIICGLKSQSLDQITHILKVDYA